MTRSFTRFLVVLVAASLSRSALAHRGTVAIVASGEAHAMLQPCDCPDAPGGGFAERATVIDSVRRKGPLLLVDAGGFAAGGIYDTYTGGRSADSLRTVAAIRAMGLMRYDAVAIGDDELQYPVRWLTGAAGESKLPLVSANVRFSDGNFAAPRFVVIDRGGCRFGITSVTTQERLFPLDTSVRVGDPVAALKEIWADLESGSDVQCILSHLGEEHSRRLATVFPGAELIVNGHRKSTTEPVTRVGKTAQLQFGYEGKALSVLSGAIAAGTVERMQGQWIPVTGRTHPDSAVAAVIGPALQVGGPKTAAVYDLYIMSQCPYGIPALREMVQLADKIPGTALTVWFIGSVHGDSSLSSLHGAPEIRDEMWWLSVQHLRPDAWMPFLRARASSEKPTADLLTGFGIDTAALSAWIRQRGRSVLAEHYGRSTRLGVSASPTLFVNNMAYSEPITWQRIGRKYCGAHRPAFPWCDSLPECVEDADCRTPGKRGECVGEQGGARCVFHDDAGFTLTVLRAARGRRHPERAIIQTTLDLFPGAVIDSVDWESDRGRSLFDKYSPSALPFYRFDPRVRAAHHFPRIERGLVDRGDHLTFQDGIVRRSFFPNRPLTPGTVEVFVDPLVPDLRSALEAALGSRDKKSCIRVFPVFFSDPSTAPDGVEERLRREEAERWLVLRSRYPDRFADYRVASLTQPGSTYWFLHLQSAGVGLRKFLREKTHAGSGLGDHWKRLQDLGITEPCTVVFDNREVVVVENARELPALIGNSCR